MKSSSFTRASLSTILQPVFSLRSNPGRLVASSVTVKPQPQIPLYLRPPAFSATPSELKTWHTWAKEQSSSVGPTFADLDNGPDSTLLHRELKWLVEDAIEQHTTDNYYESATPVRLRTCLDDLYKLWKQRIEERRPFQYVVGCEHWRDLILSVEEGVLIPRPETEIIVDFVDNAVKGNGELRNGVWADLGTGSGALAIGIARVLGLDDCSCGSVIATDLSPLAVTVAAYNVERYNLQDRVRVRQGSWFDPLKDVEGELSGLVSNPPYIPSENINGLQAEVSKHEPRLALDGGPNGMNDLLHLCKGAASMLKPGGFFAFETNGETQSKFLVNYMSTEIKGSFDGLNILSDFAGIQRFVTGYRTG